MPLLASVGSVRQRAKTLLRAAGFGRRPRLLIFFVPLPQPLRIEEKDVFAFVAPHGSAEPLDLFRMMYADKTDSDLFYVSIRFWREATQESNLHRVWNAMANLLARLKNAPRNPSSFLSVLFGDKNPTLEGGSVTIAEIATPLPRADARWRETRQDPTSDVVSDAFDFSLVFLDRIIKSYRVSQNEPVVRVSHEQFPYCVPAFIRVLRKRRTIDEPILYVLQPRPSLDPTDPLNDDEFESLWRTLDAQNNKSPAYIYRERIMEAKTALFVQGDYSQAVVVTHTAAEVLLDNLLTIMLWEEGTSPQDAAKDIFTKRLKPRVRRFYHSRLGGNWDTTGSGPVGKWAQICSPLRNRVVHSAYEVTRTQARLCYDLTTELERYVLDLVASRVDAYPRTAFMTLGHYGLTRRGLLGHDLLRLSEDPTEPHWVAAHESWTRQLADALETT